MMHAAMPKAVGGQSGEEHQPGGENMKFGHGRRLGRLSGEFTKAGQGGMVRSDADGNLAIELEQVRRAFCHALEYRRYNRQP